MLDAYFNRIGFTGSRDRSLATLRQLQSLHVAKLPFENLDPFLRRPVLLDIPSLVAKLVMQKRGGYCFEQNALFKAVLEELGFAVQGIAARIHWMSSPEVNPRAHMGLIVVTEEGPYFVDVGFGGYIVDGPLKLEIDKEQRTATSIFRFVKPSDHFILQVIVNGTWQNIYQFTTDPTFPIDYEMSNWYTSTHPESKFRTALIMSNVSPVVRLRLLNKRLTRRYTDGRTEETLLDTAAKLNAALENEFGIEPPVPAEVLFDRLPS